MNKNINDILNKENYTPSNEKVICFPAKIGLSDEDREKMANDVKTDVISSVGSGEPKKALTEDEIRLLEKDEGIILSTSGTSNGYLWVWNSALGEYSKTDVQYQGRVIDINDPVIKDIKEYSNFENIFSSDKSLLELGQIQPADGTELNQEGYIRTKFIEVDAGQLINWHIKEGYWMHIFFYNENKAFIDILLYSDIESIKDFLVPMGAKYLRAVISASTASEEITLNNYYIAKPYILIDKTNNPETSTGFKNISNNYINSLNYVENIVKEKALGIKNYIDFKNVKWEAKSRSVSGIDTAYSRHRLTNVTPITIPQNRTITIAWDNSICETIDIFLYKNGVYDTARLNCSNGFFTFDTFGDNELYISYIKSEYKIIDSRVVSTTKLFEIEDSSKSEYENIFPTNQDEVENGWIDQNNNTLVNQEGFVRTKNFIPVPMGRALKLDVDGYMRVLFYDQNQNYMEFFSFTDNALLKESSIPMGAKYIKAYIAKNGESINITNFLKYHPRILVNSIQYPFNQNNDVNVSNRYIDSLNYVNNKYNKSLLGVDNYINMVGINWVAKSRDIPGISPSYRKNRMTNIEPISIPKNEKLKIVWDSRKCNAIEVYLYNDGTYSKYLTLNDGISSFNSENNNQLYINYLWDSYNFVNNEVIATTKIFTDVKLPTLRAIEMNNSKNVIRFMTWNIGQYYNGSIALPTDKFQEQFDLMKAVIDKYQVDFSNMQEARPEFADEARTIPVSDFWDWRYANLNQYGYELNTTNYPVLEPTGHTFDYDTNHYYSKFYTYINGVKVAIFNCHLQATNKPSDTDVRLREIQEMFDAVKSEEYFILSGDFNNEINQVNQMQELDIFKNAGFHLANNGEFFTWGDTLTIDNIITSSNINILHTEVSDLMKVRKDHNPLISTLEIVNTNSTPFIPKAPTTDGTYNLKVVVTSGKPKYEWIKE